jgi:hypothetical protein
VPTGAALDNDEGIAMSTLSRAYTTGQDAHDPAMTVVLLLYSETQDPIGWAYAASRQLVRVAVSVRGRTSPVS